MLDFDDEVGWENVMGVILFSLNLGELEIMIWFCFRVFFDNFDFEIL